MLARVDCPHCGSAGAICENPACGKVPLELAHAGTMNPLPPAAIDSRRARLADLDRRWAEFMKRKAQIDEERGVLKRCLDHAKASSKPGRRFAIAQQTGRDEQLCSELTGINNALGLLRAERKELGT